MILDFKVNEENRSLHEKAYNVGYNSGYSVPCMGYSEMDDWGVDKKDLKCDGAIWSSVFETYREGWFDGRRQWKDDHPEYYKDDK